MTCLGSVARLESPASSVGNPCKSMALTGARWAPCTVPDPGAYVCQATSHHPGGPKPEILNTNSRRNMRENRPPIAAHAARASQHHGTPDSRRSRPSCESASAIGQKTLARARTRSPFHRHSEPRRRGSPSTDPGLKDGLQLSRPKPPPCSVSRTFKRNDAGTSSRNSGKAGFDV